MDMRKAVEEEHSRSKRSEDRTKDQEGSGLRKVDSSRLRRLSSKSSRTWEFEERIG